MLVRLECAMACWWMCNVRLLHNWLLRIVIRSGRARRKTRPPLGKRYDCDSTLCGPRSPHHWTHAYMWWKFSLAQSLWLSRTWRRLPVWIWVLGWVEQYIVCLWCAQCASRHYAVYTFTHCTHSHYAVYTFTLRSIHIHTYLLSLCLFCCSLSPTHAHQDSFICVPRLTQMCTVTHSYLCHDSFICPSTVCHWLE